MAKPNPFASKKAPPFGKKGASAPPAKGAKPNPFAKKAAAPPDAAMPAFSKGGKAKC